MADGGGGSSEPEAAWRAVLARDPFDPAALHGLGRALLRQKRPAQAIAMLSMAAADSDDADLLTDLGTACVSAGQPAEAEPYYRRAVEADPDNHHALFNLGGLLVSLGRSDCGIGYLRRALLVEPAGGAAGETRRALAGGLIAAGNAAYGAGDMPGAERFYREAIDVGLELATGYSNLGNALTAQLRLTEALDAYRAALSIEPGNANAEFAYSLSLLLSGEDEAGWRHYEARRRVEPLRRDHERRPDLAQWRQGVDLAGKRVLVTGEQGNGDLIQYARFVPALAGSASAVVLEMPWPMAGLFRAMPGVERVIGLGDAATGCDIGCALLSLPLLLGPDAGMRPPYIIASQERLPRWTAWLDRSPSGRRIGLVCSGDSRHPRDRERSIALAAFGRMLGGIDASFVLLQTEIRDTDRAAFEAADNLRCPGAALTDYMDTAALLSGLDLLISVDTSVAHLAGAMDLPVWTLLPYCPDYRWKLGREDSPWYPSMRLYRQSRPGDWDGVLQRVQGDLTR